jgi:tetratricopeptide (TPR) repeat protein
MSDLQRIDDLRRRVQTDPASIAFAQLAEELRRAGQLPEAVATCRAGLAIHPAYLSARVTLARALMELSDLDAARTEFELVLRNASDNLAAIRGLGDIHQREGAVGQALEHYRSALDIAPNDPDIEHAVAILEGQVREDRVPDEQVDLTADAAFDESDAAIEEADTTVLFGAEPEHDPARDSALRTVAALEQWLAAIHVARADRRA